MQTTRASKPNKIARITMRHEKAPLVPRIPKKLAEPICT